MRQVRFTRAARADFAAAFAWYEGEQPGLGEEFRRAVEAVLPRLQRNPLASRGLDERFRSILIRRFPYRVIFEFDAEHVTVHAVFHTSQNPDKWRRRTGAPG